MTMEPLSLIFSAIVAGAAAAAKPTAELAVKDAYSGLKALIKRKWNRVEVESLERDPADKARQQLVKSDLEKADDLADGELLKQAQHILAPVNEHDRAAAASSRIPIEALKSRPNFNIESLG